MQIQSVYISVLELTVMYSSGANKPFSVWILKSIVYL